MRILAIVVIALTLAACSKPELPPVSVMGPNFEASRFNCGPRPVPPDPATAGAKAASAAARYEQRQDSYGQRCQNKLTSVGVELAAAGQLVTPPATKKGK